MKDLSLNHGHLEAQSWQSPPLSRVDKTKVGRVERQREEGERHVNPGRLGEDAGGRRETVARLAEGLDHFVWPAGRVSPDRLDVSLPVTSV